MTQKIKEIVYGLGGFDKSKPENNLVDIIYYSKDELAALAEAQAKAQAKAELLERLGITADEAKLLLA
jgi:hypothetical protein